MSTPSCAVWESLRVLPLTSWIRVCEELGVGRGDPEGVRLGPGSLFSSGLSAVAAIGGKDGENTDGGRFSSEAGPRW